MRLPKSIKNQKGFTLIELLVVIAIIAILAVVVFVALDPVTRFADARNSRRWNDVNNVLTAVHEYIVDNDGDLPYGISTSVLEMGTCSTAECPEATGCTDQSSNLAAFLKSIPTDPSAGDAANTGYTITADSNNIVTISACKAENSEVIEVSR